MTILWVFPLFPYLLSGSQFPAPGRPRRPPRALLNVCLFITCLPIGKKVTKTTMERTFVLFEVPPEVGCSPSRKQILVTSEYTAAVGDDGVLTVYSQTSKAVVGTMAGVSSVCWVELTFMKGCVLVALVGDSVSVIAFGGSLPQAVPFL